MRVGRIELPSRPWQGRILPLNHTRSARHGSMSPACFTSAPTRTASTRIDLYRISTPCGFYFAQECFIKCSQGIRFLDARPPDVLRGTSSLCSYVPRPGIEPRIRRPKRRVISVSPSGRICHSTTKRTRKE